jgi:hypothetical protein
MKFKTAKRLATLFYGIGIGLIFVAGMLLEDETIKRYALYVAVAFAAAGFIVNFNWGKCPYCGRVIKVNMFGNLYTQKCMYCNEKPFIDPEDKQKMEEQKNKKNKKKKS